MSKRLSDAEWLANFQRKDPEERHCLMLCELTAHYKAAKKGKTAWAFERSYLKLKSYMKMHHWNKDFIFEKFGVTYKELTDTYFAVVGS